MTTNSEFNATLRELARRDPSTRHYPCLVGGREVDTDQITYGIDVAALLDPVEGGALWRRVLAGDAEAADHPYVLGSVAVADDALVTRAVEAASAAAPSWARVPPASRLALAGEVRHRLLTHRDRLTALMLAEGCPQVLVDWQIAVIANALDERSVSWWGSQMVQELEVDRRRIRLVRRPDGVVGFNPPRNAPAGSAVLSVGVLAAGNSVVLRVPRSIPVSLSYLAAEIMLPALDACGAPPGTLNVVCADQPPVMRLWLDHPAVDTVYYIGSSANGLALERSCVQAGKKPVLELSGNDGVLVWSDADLDRAAEALAECFLGSGQICMAPNYVMVHPAVADDLLGRLVTVAEAQKAGDPRTPGVTLSPLLKPGTFTRRLEEAQQLGAQVMCGGRRIGPDHRPAERGLFVEPTVLRIDGLAQAARHRVVREETFFPLLPVVVPDPDDDDTLLAAMISFMNANHYGLRNSLWARSPGVIDEFLAGVTNGGNLKVNDSHLSCPRIAPTHGGTGRTGGVWGEADHPINRTSRLQASTIGPLDESPAQSRVRIWP